MATIKFTLNSSPQTVDVSPEMPLLWILRDTLGMTGTKFGCGMALCGACTVHLNGDAVRSCITPASAIAGKSVTTIEGLSPDGNHPVQQAWIEEDTPQCGYCQSGQIMTAASLLTKKANPTDADIDEALRGNICRCGTYSQIRRAVHLAAKIKANGGKAWIPQKIAAAATFCAAPPAAWCSDSFCPNARNSPRRPRPRIFLDRPRPASPWLTSASEPMRA
jgi:aerobic-type carbon monoxide dehydrogenase small subunit (CoxS/CutS family)